MKLAELTSTYKVVGGTHQHIQISLQNSPVHTIKLAELTSTYKEVGITHQHKVVGRTHQHIQ